MRDLASVPTVREKIRDMKRIELGRAAREKAHAEKDFYRIRRDNDLHLREFLEARQKGEADGTLTDFDLLYFLKRGEANRRLAAAESEYAHVRKEA